MSCWQHHFRRVGRTGLFAFSKDPDHPSRAITTENDTPSNIELYSRPKVMQERTADPSKLELFDLIFDRNTPLGKINTCIKKSREHDPKMIHRVNEFGLTPLHIAACRLRVEVIRLLLDPDLRSIGVTTATPDIFRRDNVYGSTPLELCEFDESQDMLDLLRVGVLGPRKKTVNVLECSYELRKAMGEDLGGCSQANFVRNGKWECTCGRCIDGLISPRTKSYMQCKFNVLPAIMLLTYSLCQGKTEMYADTLEVGGNLWEEALCKAAFDILNSNALPTVEAILARANQGEATWQEAEHCLHSAILPDPELELMINEDSGIPACSNDYNFDLVRHELEVPYFEYYYKNHC